MNGLSSPPPAPPPAPAMEIPEPVIRVKRAPGARSGGGRRRRSSAVGAVRYTLDLELDAHRRLRLAALDRHTDASEIVRALIELLDDEVVARRLAEHLEVSSGG